MGLNHLNLLTSTNVGSESWVVIPDRLNFPFLFPLIMSSHHSGYGAASPVVGGHNPVPDPQWAWSHPLVETGGTPMHPVLQGWRQKLCISHHSNGKLMFYMGELFNIFLNKNINYN